MAKSMNDLAADLGMTPRRVRALHRSYVRSQGGVIGTDTPGKGKRYSLDARDYAAFKKHVTARAASESKDKSEAETPSE